MKLGRPIGLVSSGSNQTGPSNRQTKLVGRGLMSNPAIQGQITLQYLKRYGRKLPHALLDIMEIHCILTFPHNVTHSLTYIRAMLCEKGA